MASKLIYGFQRNIFTVAFNKNSSSLVFKNVLPESLINIAAERVIYSCSF
jgi:hypothetical protein